MKNKNKKLLLAFVLFMAPLFAVGQLIVDDGITNPTDFPWCYEKTEKDTACYDGISYAYLIEKGVAVEDYPITKTDFLLIQDSLQ